MRAPINLFGTFRQVYFNFGNIICLAARQIMFPTLLAPAVVVLATVFQFITKSMMTVTNVTTTTIYLAVGP